MEAMILDETRRLCPELYPEIVDAKPEHRPSSHLGTACSHWDVSKIREDFPILTTHVNGKQLVWFDNAATTQKPSCVIDRLRWFYEKENSNVHRGAHTLARVTTDAYERARQMAAAFLGAAKPEEIVFVRGATEGINLVAQAYGQHHLAPGDEVLITELEHHANVVPWQLLCRSIGARLRVCPVDDNGQISLQTFSAALTAKTRLVSFPHISNVLGTMTPAGDLVRLAHHAGAVVLIDGAQAAAHLPVDVQSLDADFYVFSGHKVYGPTGIGVLYGKYHILEAMSPYQGGGNMILDVTHEKSRYQAPPHKFEAGTGSIADAIALDSALRYVSDLGFQAIEQWEHQLLLQLRERLNTIPGLMLLTPGALPSAIVSFHVRGASCSGVAQYLDDVGIAVRAGHHCAQPLLRRFGHEESVRVSLALYNTTQEIDLLAEVLANYKKKP